MKTLGDIIRGNLAKGVPLSTPALEELRRIGREDALRQNAANILGRVYEGKKVSPAQLQECRKYFPEAVARIAPSSASSHESESTALKKSAWERFAQEVARGANKAEAYRAAYPRAAGWSSASVRVKACELAKRAEVAARIEALLAEAARGAVIDAREFGERLTRRFRACDDADDVEGLVKVGGLLAKTVPGLQAASKVEVKDGGVTDDYVPRMIGNQTTEELVRIVKGLIE